VAKKCPGCGKVNPNTILKGIGRDAICCADCNTSISAFYKMEDRISAILKSFKILDGIYKREQIDAAIEIKEEITPYLIKILKKKNRR
jgi:hypothetical protein